MPEELGLTTITGRRPDFSLISSPRESVIIGSEKNDILLKMIHSISLVNEWMAEKKAEIDQRYERNMAAIDAEIDLAIKGSGGLNGLMDSSSSTKAVAKELGAVARLYLEVKSKADEKITLSKGLYSGKDAHGSKTPNGTEFVRGKLYKVSVDQFRLANWANSYEAEKLSYVYAEMAGRLKDRLDFLTKLQESQFAQMAKKIKSVKEKISVKQYPVGPPGVSLEKNLQEAKSQKEYFNNGGEAFLLSWFYNKVKNRGDWDYKQSGSEYESFGNFNYGAVGTAAGISEAMLLQAAGAAQVAAGTSDGTFGKWWDKAPYGDDPMDQLWIEAGISYAKSKGH